ncbi:MAG TPA: acyl-ACP--UDP-N-acetylglucosamine O-acyltransferase [Candidatus Sabulitectum sp.]|nr:acyl-ACP--UDP-N-acetylglucosamine O-acyltransferase [Candidatus Sabulitectum sp.]HPF33173.1 acyl-ACP--UDP-N-acetylglucosamine O-acyltransferase [Candidatus Sabulitectum sp.]HPJ29560.1 acyl-ACP--UDP-N-acetylglucosamine O-acyltransferase [Candidatus Sabulitectum sp.]HPR23377.1 acyl-ACP--UDP-N-acetylglucosamine O-acyltransferase [Candidatus Sabulitectum sp.]
MIHETAVVRCGVPDSAVIGPFAVVGESVTLGEGVVIGAHAVVEGITTLGDGVKVGPGAVIGTPPQDLKYQGERTILEVGRGTVIREMANINCGTGASGRTVIGEDCFLMAYSHVAHDCVIGNGVILANSVNLAGHVEVGNRAIIGGVVPVHQFTRIGEFSMIGGGYRVSRDVTPFTLAGGEPLRAVGINKLGLRRNGFSNDEIQEAVDGFHALFREGGTMAERVESALSSHGSSSFLVRMAEFIRASSRGVTI